MAIGPSLHIVGTLSDQTTTDAAAIHPFASVQVVDNVPDQIETVIVSESQAQGGALTHLGSGSFNAVTGIYTDSGTAAQITADLQGLTFEPTAHQVTPGQSVTTNLALVVEDNFGGVAQDATTSVTATAVENAPVISGTAAGQTTTDAAPIHPFANVQITDVDAGKVETLTVSEGQAQNGALTHLGSGSFDAATGIYTDSGTAGQITADLQGLTFEPTAHQVTPGQSVTTNLALVVEDNFGGVAQDATTSVTATAVENAPVISGTAAGQTTTDAAAIHPFASVQITDVDAGKVETLTVSEGQAQNGALTHLGSGSFDAATGIYTDSGTAGQITADLQGLTFEPTAHQVTPGQSVTTNFALAVKDNFGGVAQATTSVTATAISPSLHTVGTLSGQTTTDASAINPFAGVQVVDNVPGQIETLTVSESQTQNGTLTHLGSGSFDAATGTYTDSGTAGQITADLQGLTFAPTAHQVAPGQSVTTTFTVTTKDAFSGTIQDTSTSVTTTAVENAPVISGTAAGQTTTDAAAIHPFASVQITDVDAGKVETLTVSEGQAQNGALTHLGSGSFNAATGIYTDSGTAAQITADLQGLTFEPTAHQVAPGQSVTTNFALVVEDNFGGVAQDPTTSVTAISPSLHTVGTLSSQTTTDAAAINPFAGVQVVDNVPGQIETLTVSEGQAQNGTLTHLGSGSFDAATGIYTDSGTAGQITADLQGLTFEPIAHQVTPGQSVTTNLALVVKDNFGGVAQATTSVTATAISPSLHTVGALSSQTTTDAAAINPFAGVQVVDNVPGQIETLTVSEGQAQNGTLTHLGSGSFDAATGIYTDSGTAGQITADLQGLTFEPIAHQVTPGQSVTTNLALVVKDNFGGVAQATTSVTATAISPSLHTVGALSSQTTTDAAAINPFAGVQVVDNVPGQIETLTVSESQAQNGTLTHLGSGSFDAATGTYTDSGTAGQITADLQGLTFAPTAHQVAPGQSVTTTFTVTTKDAFSGTIQDASTSVTTTAVENAPVISGTAVGQITTDAAAIHAFANVRITDLDAGKVETLTVSEGQAQNGALTHLGSGSFDAATGIYTDSGTAGQITADLQGLTFEPTAHQVTPGQSVTTNLALVVEDNFGGVAQDATTSVTATAVENAPVISGTAAGQTTTDAAAIHPFASVQITDVDAGKVETLTVSEGQAQNGALTHLGSGSFDAATGIYTDSGTAGQITADLQGLTFEPTAHQVTPGQSVTTNFALVVKDNFGGVAQATTSVTATAVENAPVISGTAAGQTMTDAAAIHPFASVQITDVDAGKVEKATVVMTQPQNGALTHLGNGHYDAATGVYTDNGTATNVTADLRALSFQLTAHEAGPAQSISTSFALIVQDNFGDAASDSTTSVVTQLLAHKPQSSGAVHLNPPENGNDLAPAAQKASALYPEAKAGNYPIPPEQTAYHHQLQAMILTLSWQDHSQVNDQAGHDLSYIHGALTADHGHDSGLSTAHHDLSVSNEAGNSDQTHHFGHFDHMQSHHF